MKRWIALGLVAACAAIAQGANFTNLDFEAYAGSGTDWLPGWEWDTAAFNSYGINPCPLVTASVGLVTPSATCGTWFEGEYSAFLSTGEYQEYVEEYGWVPVCCGAPTISQTATVPANAAYIRYTSTPPYIWDSHTGFHWDMRVQGSLGGIVLSNGVTTDIRSLAGQEAALSFTVIGTDDPESPGSWHSLDQIEFLDENENVIWPVPVPPPPLCLDDFHAATLNTSLWEVVNLEGQTNTVSISAETLRISAAPPAAPFETDCRYRSTLRGDWDVRMDFRNQAVLNLMNSTNPGYVGMALAARFGPEEIRKAGVGHRLTISNAVRHYGMDWGQGPANELPTEDDLGTFRLVRSGWDVAGYVWNAGSNAWQIVGTLPGFTDETARVGLEVWSSGAFGGKTSCFYADNLVLSNGQMCLEGLAVKMFGLDESGAPQVEWDTVGIAENNRYIVTRSTNLATPFWEPVSGFLPDEGGETNWGGAAEGAGAAYYRIEVRP